MKDVFFGDRFEDHEHQFYAGLDNKLFERMNEVGRPEVGRFLLAFRYNEEANRYEPVGKGLRTFGRTRKGEQTYATSWHQVKDVPSSDGSIGGLAKAVLEELGLAGTRKHAESDARIMRLSEDLAMPHRISYGSEGKKYADLEALKTRLDAAAAYIGVNDPNARHIFHIDRE